MSFRYAIEGIFCAIRSESHLRFHIVIGNLICVFAYFYGISKAEWATLILCIFAVISAELLNTAVDFVKNHFDTELIVIEAQVYAADLYKKIGFVQTSEEFLEDGIPHIQMMLNCR